jgi:hypothetical protein
MIVKMLTHMHMVMYTWGVGTFAKAMVFERLRGAWGPLSLSPSLRVRDSGVFEEIK